MKLSKIITLLLVLTLGTKCISQNKETLEKSIFGVETGFLGFWINNETRLITNLSLKSEKDSTPEYLEEHLIQKLVPYLFPYLR